MNGTLLFLADIGSIEGVLLVFAILPLLTAFHFLPSIIGMNRPNRLVIFLVNFFAGWSIIGWLIALYLALKKAPALNPSSYSTGPTGASLTSVADEISKLRDLRDQGILTPAEFERQKNNLLS
jgi:hypothetical protein